MGTIKIVVVVVVVTVITAIAEEKNLVLLCRYHNYITLTQDGLLITICLLDPEFVDGSKYRFERCHNSEDVFMAFVLCIKVANEDMDSSMSHSTITKRPYHTILFPPHILSQFTQHECSNN